MRRPESCVSDGYGKSQLQSEMHASVSGDVCSMSLYMDRDDCIMREIHSKSIINTTMGSSLVALHATSSLDYTKPNNFLCWHCASPFDTPPVPVPTSYDLSRKVFVVEGNLCSFACAKAYIHEQRQFDSGHRLLMLKQIALMLYGADIEPITAAPPRTALEAFGGNMTIDDFRACTTQVRVDCPPFVPQRRIVEVRANDARTTSWSVYNLRRSVPEDTNAVPEGGERGLYMDFLHQQKTLDEDMETDVPAQSAAVASGPATRARGALSEFMK